MPIQIGNNSFDGPYQSSSSLNDRSGVYVILAHKSSTNQLFVVDVGESRTVRSRVQNHDRKPCWQRNKRDGLRYAAYYTSRPTERAEIEKAIRQQYDPPCGDR